MLTPFMRALGLACGGMLAGCAADEAMLDVAPRESASAAEEPAPRIFTVILDSTTTEESVIPAIVAAGHETLVAACEGIPGSSVRIVNPLASGSYMDVSCAAILGTDGATGEAGAALTSDADGALGQAQQKWSPFGLACGLLVGGAALVATRALCPRGRTTGDRTKCGNLADFGFFGLAVACTFM